MTYQGIDTAARITPQIAEKLRAEGISFVARYLVPESGSTAWKALSAAEASDIRAAGLALMLCWETAADRVKGGAAAGSQDGAKARELAEAMGVPTGTVIYFAADYDVPAADLPAADAYYRAARIACGQYNAGIYGGKRVCAALGAATAWIWQCVAWSNLFLSFAHVIQYQWQGSPDAKAMAEKVGVAVDLNAAASLAGMWLPPKTIKSTKNGGEKMKETFLKGALTVILAGAAAYFQQLIGPLIVLAIVMIADYITGMAAAWVAGQLSSRAGIIGIVKKIGYLFAVGVAIVVDYIITFAATNAGADLTGFHIFGLLVSIWLILNECISILENLSEIGVPLPNFLLAIVKKLKKSTEKTGDDQARPDSDTALLDAIEDPYAAFGVSGDLPDDLPDAPPEDLPDER